MSTQHTPGPWVIATSNSWRRVLGLRGQPVCEPITQRDGHPDLHFRNGGAEGPDARLIAGAPVMFAMLEEIAVGGDEWSRNKATAALTKVQS